MRHALDRLGIPAVERDPELPQMLGQLLPKLLTEVLQQLGIVVGEPQSLAQVHGWGQRFVAHQCASSTRHVQRPVFPDATRQWPSSRGGSDVQMALVQLPDHGPRALGERHGSWGDSQESL